MTRRKFSREFKIEAVKLVMERGVSVAEACRDLEVAESVLRRWMREQAASPATAFPGNGQMRAEVAEIAALKKEVAKLKAERDILKKATAFFAREAVDFHSELSREAVSVVWFPPSSRHADRVIGP